MRRFSTVQEIIQLPVVEAAWKVEYGTDKSNGWGNATETVVQVGGIKYLLTGNYDIAGSGTSSIQVYALPGGIALNWQQDNQTSVSSSPSMWHESNSSDWEIKQRKIK